MSVRLLSASNTGNPTEEISIKFHIWGKTLWYSGSLSERLRYLVAHVDESTSQFTQLLTGTLNISDKLLSDTSKGTFNSRTLPVIQISFL